MEEGATEHPNMPDGDKDGQPMIQDDEPAGLLELWMWQKCTLDLGSCRWQLRKACQVELVSTSLRRTPMDEHGISVKQR